MLGGEGNWIQINTLSSFRLGHVIVNANYAYPIPIYVKCNLATSSLLYFVVTKQILNTNFCLKKEIFKLNIIQQQQQ